MLHSMEVEFPGGGVGVSGVNSNNHVKPNSVEVVLRSSWGCDNNKKNWHRAGSQPRLRQLALR